MRRSQKRSLSVHEDRYRSEHSAKFFSRSRNFQTNRPHGWSNRLVFSAVEANNIPVSKYVSSCVSASRIMHHLLQTTSDFPIYQPSSIDKGLPRRLIEMLVYFFLRMYIEGASARSSAISLTLAMNSAHSGRNVKEKAPALTRL